MKYLGMHYELPTRIAADLIRSQSESITPSRLGSIDSIRQDLPMHRNLLVASNWSKGLTAYH